MEFCINQIQDPDLNEGCISFNNVLILDFE